MILEIGSHYVKATDKPLKETMGLRYFEKAYPRLPDLLIRVISKAPSSYFDFNSH